MTGFPMKGKNYCWIIKEDYSNDNLEKNLRNAVPTTYALNKKS